MRVLATEAWSRSAWSVPRIKQEFYGALILLALVTLCHHTARANSVSGQIAGTVIDQTGATVGGAWIVLLGTAGLETQRSLTDQRGHFTLEQVQAANYVVCVQKNGFREIRRVLHLTPGETLQLQFQLNVASIFETVTVTPARGVPQGLFDVPQSPDVITEEEIAHRAANILSQALRDVPGVHIQAVSTVRED